MKAFSYSYICVDKIIYTGIVFAPSRSAAIEELKEGDSAIKILSIVEV